MVEYERYVLSQKNLFQLHSNNFFQTGFHSISPTFRTARFPAPSESDPGKFGGILPTFACCSRENLLLQFACRFEDPVPDFRPITCKKKLDGLDHNTFLGFTFNVKSKRNGTLRAKVMDNGTLAKFSVFSARAAHVALIFHKGRSMYPR